MKKKIVDPDFLKKKRQRDAKNLLRHRLSVTEHQANHLHGLIRDIESRFGIEIKEDYSQPDTGVASVTFDKTILRGMSKEGREVYIKRTGERLAKYALSDLGEGDGPQAIQWWKN